MTIPLVNSRAAYDRLHADLAERTPTEQQVIMRELCKGDLFYLLIYGCNASYADNDFVFDKCRMVQAAPDGFLDVWAREHFKSTIITFALNIMEILNDPEVTIGIFSYARPIAKQFLRQIKRELETNDVLKELFPDILWQNPNKEAPKWSEDDGLVVRRKGNPKESTVEAWGLIDGQPTSKHFAILDYDDIVVKRSVTENMIPKVTEEWEHSLSLGKSPGGRRRYTGTIYARYDTYHTMRERGIPMRWHPATHDGTFEGIPVLWPRETLEEKRREMGSDTFATQILLRPEGSGGTYFREEDVRYYQMPDDLRPPNWKQMYRCLLVDPASERKKKSDWTSMMVLGFAADQNVYVLDWRRDRMKLKGRIEAMFELHRRWELAYFDVGYERYGKDADIEAIELEQARRNYHFEIQRLGGPMPKTDRIKRLQPYLERHQVWLPHELYFVDYEGKRVDLVTRFVKHELGPWTGESGDTLWDDDLDNLSRMFDLYRSGLPFPIGSNVHAMDAVNDYDVLDGFSSNESYASDDYDVFDVA